MKEPLKAFGPDGTIIAYSYNGGTKWSQVPVKKSEKVKNRSYTRRIAAVLPLGGITPSFERRIINSFAPLADANILAGWGPLGEIMTLSENALDGIVLPYGAIPFEETSEAIVKLKEVGKIVYLDIDSSVIANRAEFSNMVECIKRADAIIVPSDSIANTLRKFNSIIFSVPPTVNVANWLGKRRVAVPGVIRIAVQPTANKWVHETMEWAQEKWGDKITYQLDDWENRSVVDDPEFYTNIDIVVVGPPVNRHESTNQCLLSPMMAGCMIIADGAYSRTINHMHSGIVVSASGPSPWRKEFTHAITDSRTRIKMQAGARQRVESYISRSLLSRLAMPYKRMIKEHE